MLRPWTAAEDTSLTTRWETMRANGVPEAAVAGIIATELQRTRIAVKSRRCLLQSQAAIRYCSCGEISPMGLCGACRQMLESRNADPRPTALLTLEYEDAVANAIKCDGVYAVSLHLEGRSIPLHVSVNVLHQGEAPTEAMCRATNKRAGV